MTVLRAASAEDQPGSRLGNTLLRDFFMDRYVELHSERPLFPGTLTDQRRVQVADPLAERFVDAQVDHFMTVLERKIGEMNSGIKELETVRQDAVSGRLTRDRSTQVRLGELAQHVGDRAGDLFEMVSLVTVDLRPKNDLSLPPTSAGSDFFGDALKFLAKQVAKAKGRLNDLFLEPTHVVDLDELRGDNVLTELKSIEQVSKDIKKAVDSSSYLDNAE